MQFIVTRTPWAIWGILIVAVIAGFVGGIFGGSHQAGPIFFSNALCFGALLWCLPSAVFTLCFWLAAAISDDLAKANGARDSRLENLRDDFPRLLLLIAIVAACGSGPKFFGDYYPASQGLEFAVSAGLLIFFLTPTWWRSSVEAMGFKAFSPKPKKPAVASFPADESSGGCGIRD